MSKGEMGVHLIFLSLSLGIMVGVFLKLPDKLVRFNSKFQMMGLFLLIFTMGIRIGSDKNIIKNIKLIGIKSFSFAVFTAFFSAVAVYIVYNKFLREE